MSDPTTNVPPVAIPASAPSAADLQLRMEIGALESLDRACLALDLWAKSIPSKGLKRRSLEMLADNTRKLAAMASNVRRMT